MFTCSRGLGHEKVVSRKISDETIQSISNVEAFFEHLRRASLPSLSRRNALQERDGLKDTAAPRQWVILGDVDVCIDGNRKQVTLATHFLCLCFGKSMLGAMEASRACFR